MQCPICHDEMTIRNESTSYNRRENNKEYAKTVYVCRKDDAWVTTDLPKQQSASKEAASSPA